MSGVTANELMDGFRRSSSTPSSPDSFMANIGQALRGPDLDSPTGYDEFLRQAAARSGVSTDFMNREFGGRASTPSTVPVGPTPTPSPVPINLSPIPMGPTPPSISPARSAVSGRSPASWLQQWPSPSTGSPSSLSTTASMEAAALAPLLAGAPATPVARPNVLRRARRLAATVAITVHWISFVIKHDG